MQNNQNNEIIFHFATQKIKTQQKKKSYNTAPFKILHYNFIGKELYTIS